MPEKVTVLLVSDGREPFEKLELALDNQGVKTCRTASSAEVLPLLEKPDSPQMIFTDTGPKEEASHAGTAGFQKTGAPAASIRATAHPMVRTIRTSTWHNSAC